MSVPALVSIVIPTWNRVRFVREAIASVAAQTFADWELIVVDDGSTDETLETLGELDDPRIRLIASPHSGSAAIARNRGIEAARGQWIAFLDSDDRWRPRKLEIQLDALSKSGADWCYTDFDHIDEHGEQIAPRIHSFRALNGRIVESLLLGQAAAGIVTLLVRRELVEAVGGFDPTLRRREDLDFAFRIALAGDAVAVPEKLAEVRDHDNRKTSATNFPHEHSARVYERFLVREPQLREAKAARKMLARHLAEAASERVRSGNLASGAKLLTRALLLGDAPAHWLRAAARALGIRRRR